VGGDQGPCQLESPKRSPRLILLPTVSRRRVLCVPVSRLREPPRPRPLRCGPRSPHHPVSHSWKLRKALPLRSTLPMLNPTFLRARSAGDAALDRSGMSASRRERPGPALMSAPAGRSLSLCESTHSCQGSGLAASLAPRSWHEPPGRNPTQP
jgi:hypothetical protein